MAPVTTNLTVEQYRERYANTKGAEFWFGEVRFKSVPTWLHALLQGLLAQLFTQAGYASGSELELRIDPNWEPRPDVAASLLIEEPYPTKPIDIAAEILSPGDSLHDVEEKCLHYARIGIRQIFVLDPERKTIREWAGGVTGGLAPVVDIVLGNGVTITGRTLWTELERRRRQPLEPPDSKMI